MDHDLQSKASSQGLRIGAIALLGLGCIGLVVGSRGSEAAAPHWEKVSGPKGVVLAYQDELFATEGPGLNPTGDLYRYKKSENKWIKVGGPGKQFVIAPGSSPRVIALSPDGKGVYEYLFELGLWPSKWLQIGGPAKEIYAGGAGIFATNPETGDLYRYENTPMKWKKIGGPGKMFAVSWKTIYGIAPDGQAVMEYLPASDKWMKIGGPAAMIFAGSVRLTRLNTSQSAVVDLLYATNPTSGTIHLYQSNVGKWIHIGGPAKMFAVNLHGELYGLAPDSKSVWAYSLGLSWPQGESTWQYKDIGWKQIGGPAGRIMVGPGPTPDTVSWGDDVFATNPQTGDVMRYKPN